MILKNQYVFYSISELVEALDNSKLLKDEDDYYRSTTSDADRSSDWSDTKTYDEAREKLLYGFEYDDLNKVVDDYRSHGSETKQRPQLSVAGHQVVVPMYLQGIPNSMITNKRVINNKIVTIVYDCSVPSHVDSDDIMETTKELFLKVMSLEEQGYRVNLWITEVNADDDGKWGFALRLKTDREVFNAKKMMFPLISSSFLRRITFKIKENLYKDWIGGGYGSARYDREIIDKFIRRNLGVSRYELWRYDGKKEGSY